MTLFRVWFYIYRDSFTSHYLRVYVPATILFLPD